MSPKSDEIIFLFFSFSFLPSFPSSFLPFFLSSFLFLSPSPFLSLFLPFTTLFRYNSHLTQSAIYSVQSMVVSIFRGGHHEPINFRTFHRPKRNSIPLFPTSSPSPGQPIINLFLVFMNLFMLDISYKWKRTNMVFCHWLLSLSIMWSRPTPVVMCCNSSSLLFIAK